MTRSNDDQYHPGASGSVRFVEPDGGQWRYNFARQPDDSIKYRKMDGITYTDWADLNGVAGERTHDFPAAAGPSFGPNNGFISVFVAGPDNRLRVTRTFNGSDYVQYNDLGGVVNAAPTAACLIFPDSSYRVFVFVRGSDNQIYMQYSSDGYNFTPGVDNYLGLGSPPGGAAAAPVAIITKNAFGEYILSVLAKAINDGKLYITQLTGSGRGTNGVADFNGWNVRNSSVALVGPPNEPNGQLARDYPVVMDVGVDFITTNAWAYQMTAFSNMRPQLAKFQMFYDWPSGNPNPVFDTTHLDDVINRGANVVIIRTAESRYGADDTDWQLNRTPLRPSGNQSVMDYIQNHPNIAFWIQVGNEPDRVKSPFNISAATARDRFLDTLRVEIPKFRPGGYRQLSNLRWLASMPTYVGNYSDPPAGFDLSYLATIINNSEIRQGYDAFGVTHYGGDTLFQQYPNHPGDGTANVVLDHVLSKTNTPVFITEAGVNRDVPSAQYPNWQIKINNQYIPDFYRIPGQVRGYAIYTLTPDAGTNRRYAVDVNTDGTMPNYDGSARVGTR